MCARAWQAGKHVAILQLVCEGVNNVNGPLKDIVPLFS